MAWSRKKKQVESPAVVEFTTPIKGGEGLTTRIGPDMVIEGKLDAREDILISGTIKGSIASTARVVVAASGKIEGEVACASIHISGEVKGNVNATEQIVIESSGRLVGDITTRTFAHQPGGFFEGYSHMLQDGPHSGKKARKEEKDEDRTAKDKGKKEGNEP